MSSPIGLAVVVQFSNVAVETALLIAHLSQGKSITNETNSSKPSQARRSS
jgi:hypothetical protein